jgi:hypothetical protein
MANLIDKTYFVYEVELPGGQYSEVLNYITRYEKEILQKLLGYELWKEVSTSVATSGHIYDLINGKEYTISLNGRDQLLKWNGLKNTDKISLIAYYVYYMYQEAKSSITTPSGPVVTKNENSVRANLSEKITDIWSRLRELYGYEGQDEVEPSAYNFLHENEADYPEWIFTDIGHVNAFDL